MTDQEKIELAIQAGQPQPGIANGTPDYQHVYYTSAGAPFYKKVGGGQLYIPPASAMSMFDEPQALAWARSKGYYIDGGREGLNQQSTVDANGVSHPPPNPVHGSAPSGGLFHTTGQWNSETGEWDQGIDWGNILTMVVAGVLTAGAASVLMGGGAAAEAAASTAASTGSVDAGIEAATAAGLADGTIGTGTGLGLGFGEGAAGTAATAGVATPTLSTAGLSLIPTGATVAEAGVAPAVVGGAITGGTVAAPLISQAASGAEGELGGNYVNEQLPAISDPGGYYTPTDDLSNGFYNTPSPNISPTATTPPVAAPTATSRLIGSLTSPGTIASLASGGLGLIGQIMAANSANENAAAQNALTRQVSALNATQLNPVSQNLDLAHASGIASAAAHGPSVLGVSRPFDTSQVQSFLSPSALAHSTANMNDQIKALGTTPNYTPPTYDLSKMGFPPGALGSVPPSAQTSAPPTSPPLASPQTSTLPSPSPAIDPRRQSLVNNVVNGVPTSPPNTQEDYFNKRKRSNYGGLQAPGDM